MAPILAYYDIRGLGEPIRYLLHFKSIEFEDKRYEDKDAWLNEKFNLKLDFPNLPYFIDGDLRLTQSVAILRHLARKYNLAGSNEEQKTRIELAEQQIVDLRTSLIYTCYNENFVKIKDDYIKNLPPQFKLWSKFLGDRQFLAGDKLTYIDFMAYDAFDYHGLLEPTILQEFPNLKQYMKRIESLPELQPYFKSSVYKRWPIFSPAAQFGGKGDEPKKRDYQI